MEHQKPASRRLSKIVCTIGSASESEDMLLRLIDAGMNVARLNFSHGDHDWHRLVCERIRRVSNHVALMGDLQGPKLRIGRMQQDRSVFLKRGNAFTLTARPVAGTAEIVSIDYPALPQEVALGDTLYLNDGLIALRVEAIHNDTDIVCEVLTGGALSSRKGINAPRVQLSAHIPTEKDRHDMQLAAALELDSLAVSFVSTAADLDQVRAIVRESGTDIPLISKIERWVALDNFDGILHASDGIMVARGDLADDARRGSQRSPSYDASRPVASNARATSAGRRCCPHGIGSRLGSPKPYQFPRPVCRTRDLIAAASRRNTTRQTDYT